MYHAMTAHLKWFLGATIITGINKQCQIQVNAWGELAIEYQGSCMFRPKPRLETSLNFCRMILKGHHTTWPWLRNGCVWLIHVVLLCLVWWRALQRVSVILFPATYKWRILLFVWSPTRSVNVWLLLPKRNLSSWFTFYTLNQNMNCGISIKHDLI